MDFYLCQLPYNSYLLIDKLVNYPQNPAAQSKGSWACRQLLQSFQQTYHLVAPLQEQNFPYFFNIQQTRYFVSFSHSCEQIAVLVSPYSRLGVDIEDKIVSYYVAKRFFHHDEVVWLNSLSKNKQSTAITLLWTLKESFIKTGIGAKDLPTGLKENCLQRFGQAKLEQLVFGEAWQVMTAENILGFLQHYRCSFMIKNTKK